jgi:hypothetical protein
MIRVSAVTDISIPINKVDIESANGIIRLGPHQSLVFESAKAEKWTMDRYDGIEAMITEMPFMFDLSPFIERFKVDCEGDSAKFRAYIRDRFEELVVRGYTSKKEIATAPFFRLGVERYINLNFLPLFQSPSNLKENKYFLGDFKNLSELEKMAAVAFWKRIMMLTLVNRPPFAERVEGGYCNVDAPGTPKPGDKGNQFPAPNEREGILVAAIMKSEGNLLSVPLGRAVKFCEKGDVIENSTGDTVFVRLGMNDNLPDDNGPGFAEIVYSIRP